MITRVDTYLHSVPLSGAVAEQVGPFTLFRSTTVWPYYARPVPGSGVTIKPDDVELVRERCAELEIPLSFEWVVDTCPSLGPAAAAAGLTVVEHPLLVLERDDFRPVVADARVEILSADENVVRQCRAVANLAFSEPGTAVGTAGPAAGRGDMDAPAFINGKATPDTVALVVGTTYRLRVIDISANDAHTLSLRGPAGPVTWRVLARDGRDLPADQTTPGLARENTAAGVTRDFEFTPATVGDYTLTATTIAKGTLTSLVTTMPIRVRAP